MVKKNLTLYLFFLIIFFYKIFSITYVPFSEDELDLVRCSFLLSQGKIPYNDYFDLSFPVIQVLLLPFVIILKNNSFIIFGIRLILLIYSFIGLYYYFRMILEFFNEKTAYFSTFVFSLSYIFFLFNVTITPSSISFPTLLIIIYFISQNKIKISDIFSPCLMLAFLVSIDHRIFLFISVMLCFGIFFKKISLKFFFVFILLCFIMILGPIFFLNKNMLSLFWVVFNTPPLRSHYTFSNIFIAWQGDLIFFLFSFLSVYKLYSEKEILILKASSLFLLMYIILLKLFFTSVRPDTFGIYIIPFIALLSGMGLKNLSFKYYIFRKIDVLYVMIIIMNFLFFSVKFLIQPSDISVKEQHQILKETLNLKKPLEVSINLSRYALNLFDINTFSLQRLEEDSYYGIHLTGTNDYFHDTIMKNLHYLSPKIIIFSKTDHFLRMDILNYIEKNYIQITPFLYQRKIDDYSSKAIYEKELNNDLFCENLINKIGSYKPNRNQT